MLPAQLGSLRRRWPKARIQVTTATCSEVRSALRAGRVDVGLVCEPMTVAGPEATMVLAPSELVLFGRANHALARAEPPPEQLRRYPVQLSDTAGSFHGVLNRYFDAAGVPPPTVMTTGSVEGVKRGVMADRESLGLLPAFAVEEDLRNGRIARISTQPALPPVVLKALWRQDHALSPVASELLEHLRTAMGGSESRGGRRAGAAASASRPQKR